MVSMKKRLFSVLLVSTMAISLVACGDKKKKGSDEPNTYYKELEASEYGDTITKNAEVYKKYVTLPDWKSMELTLDATYEITEADVNEQIEGYLSATKKTENVTSGTVANGDKIILDYAGKLNGVAFSGGTATDVTHVVGSDTFISDLEKGLVGLTVGQEADVPAKFPDSYPSSELAGKEAVFTVKVTAIVKNIVPELTDEWVASNSNTIGYDSSIKTVDAFKKAVREDLEIQAKAQTDSLKFNTLFEKILTEIGEVEKYPEAEKKALLDTITDSVDQEYSSYGSGYDSKEDFILDSYAVESMDEFNKQAEDYVNEYLLQKMVITLLADENNITVTGDDINKAGEELAKEYGYDDYAEILETYGKAMNVELGYQCLYSNVLKLVLEKGNFKAN